MAPNRYLFSASLAGLFLLALWAPWSAAQPNKGTTAADLIEFKAEIVLADPFSPQNELGAKAQFRRGEVVQLVITANLKQPDAYTYPMTRSAPGKSGAGLNSIRYTDQPGLQPLPPISEPEPELYDDKALGKKYIYRKSPITYVQDIVILPSAAPGPTSVKFAIRGQVCNEITCIPFTAPIGVFELPIIVSEMPALPLTPELEARIKSTRLAATGGSAGVTPALPPVAAKQVDTSLLGVILSSMAAAILMVFTPCVFPMIPITVSFFVKQSEKEHHKPLLTAGVYSLTIIVVLALAVVLLGGLIVKLANNAWMNLALGAVLIYFALSLFGMYDIELPSGLARFTSAREGQGGYAGAFFMALTFTITSFTCTGPFLGPLLATAATMQLSFVELLLAAFAYSTAFAAPFFFLALFPTLLKSLPKSGGWLNAVKVVMGFLELAAALKFLGNTDATLNPGNPWLFTYDTVLCSWIALSVACGLYLLGMFRLPHDDAIEHIGVIRMLLATIFFGMALHLMPALWRETPLSVLGEALVAFLPRDSRPPRTAGGGNETHLAWHLDYESAWKEAVRDNKLIFIDFTGVNCTNCRDNENRVFPKPAVRDELKKYVRVQMYNDSVPRPGLSGAQAEALAEQNMEWQKNTAGDVSTPLYVIFQPDKDKPIENGKLKGTVLSKRGGKIFDGEIDAFVAMLRKPLNGQVAQAKVVGN